MEKTVVAKTVIFPEEPSQAAKNKIRSSEMFKGIPYYSRQWRADIREYPTSPGTHDITGLLTEIGYKYFEFKNGAIYANYK